jgi:hypothetical protein
VKIRLSNKVLLTCNYFLQGNVFVKPEVRKGLLPVILEELLLARKRARALLA